MYTTYLNKKLLLLFLTLLLFNLSSLIETKNKNSVLKKKRAIFNETLVEELTSSNFTQFNSSHSNYFIFFYGAYCSKCKDFAPIFDETSVRSLNLSHPVAFARINGDKNKDIVKKFEVKTFPEIIWVDNTDGFDITEYDGKRTVKSLLKFMNTNLNFTSEELFSIENLTNKKRSGKYLVFVGDINKGGQILNIYKKIYKISKDDEIDYIYWTKSLEFYNKFNIDENSFDVLIFKSKNKTLNINSGERLNLNYNHNKNDIEKLLDIYTRKIWGKLDEITLLSSVESGSATPTVFIMYEKNASYIKDLSTNIEILSKKYRRQFWFLNTTFECKHAAVLNEVFNITKDQLPYLILIHDNIHNSDDVDKFYIKNADLSLEGIENFLKDFGTNKLNKFIYSEKLPEGNLTKDENGILKVVGHNFNKIVFENNLGKDVVLFLCVKSKKCRLARERFVNIVKKLTLNNPNLIFAEIETSYNEFSYIKYDSIPSFALIPGYSTVEERKNGVSVYSENVVSTKIIEWIKINVKNNLVIEEFTESELLSYQLELKKKIKPINKEKIEDLTSFLGGMSTGLRRTVLNEFDRDSDDLDEDHEELKRMIKENNQAKRNKKLSEARKDDL